MLYVDGNQGKRSLRLRAVVALTVGAIAGALLPPAMASAATAPADTCSWALRTNPDVVNVAYPDTSATYWSYAYRAVPGTELVIRGTYPRARYFSFHAYQPTGVALDSIYDAQVVPDKGSGNPFVQRVPKREPEHYTVTVLFTAKPAHPAANTVYAGQMAVANAPNAGGVLILRVYVPADPASPQGSVPLPMVTWQTTSGAILASGTACSSDLPATNGVLTQELNSLSFPASLPASGAGAKLVWSRAGGSQYAAAFPNQQNAYLTSTISRAQGDLVVIHGLTPTFPNTSRGTPAYRPSQVRYWSFCENSVDARVISCVPDYEVSLRGGYYTYVISDPANRPRNATAQNGVAWLPWGAVDADGVMILRNTLPAASFAEAVQNVPSTGVPTPQQVMGAYYPEASYCTTARFEKGGWQACFGAS